MKRILLSMTILLAVNIVATAQEIQDTVVLQGVEIQGTQLIRASCVVNPLTKLQLQKLPSRDMGELLRQIPNVSGVRKGGSALDPVVRGFKFSQLNVILDNGIKIENGCPNRMDPVSAHVEAEDIEKSEVIKGPFVLRYGPSFGGVINLVTQKPQPYDHFEIHGNALYGFESNWNGQKEHISLYGGNKKVYFLLSAGMRDYGNYRSGASEGKDTVFNTSFSKHNMTAKLGIAVSPSQEILISCRMIKGKDILYPALPMDEKSDETYVYSVDYQSKYISKTIDNLSIKLYRSDVDHVMDNSNRSNYNSRQMVSTVNAVNTGGRAEMNLHARKGTIQAGLDYENIQKDGTRVMTMQMMGTTSTKKSNLWKDSEINNTGLFAEYNLEQQSLDFHAAIRGDLNKAGSADTLKIIKNGTYYFYNTASQYLNISGSLGITLHLNKSAGLSVAVARGVRSPNMLERFIKLMTVGYDNYDYLGNPDLKPEKNYEADVTFTYQSNHAGKLYVNGFYSFVNDFIYAKLMPSSVITPQTQGVLGVKQFVNTDDVTFKGFEFGYTSPDSYKFGGSLVASYTRGQIASVTKYLITGNQVTGDITLQHDDLSEIPPMEATLNIYYKFLRNKLVPRLIWRQVAEQNHPSEAFYELKTPGFGILSFQITYMMNKYCDLNAGVQNIFDKSYYEHLNRKIIGSSVNLYEPGRVFYVTVSVKI